MSRENPGLTGGLDWVFMVIHLINHCFTPKSTKKGYFQFYERVPRRGCHAIAIGALDTPTHQVNRHKKLGHLTVPFKSFTLGICEKYPILPIFTLPMNQIEWPHGQILLVHRDYDVSIWYTDWVETDRGFGSSDYHQPTQKHVKKHVFFTYFIGILTTYFNNDEADIRQVVNHLQYVHTCTYFLYYLYDSFHDECDFPETLITWTLLSTITDTIPLVSHHTPIRPY